MHEDHRSETDQECTESQQAEKENLAEAQISIGERVKFWEEQDKINQLLVDRVVRQNKLLADHIRDHDRLPEIADIAIRHALADARVEQRKQYRSIVERMSATYRDTVERLLAEERNEQQKQYQAALAAAGERWQAETRKYRKRLHASLAALIGFLALISIASLIVAIAT